MREVLEEALDMTQEGKMRKKAAVHRADIPNTQQEWTMFTPKGYKITSLNDLSEGGNDVLIFEGGILTWCRNVCL